MSTEKSESSNGVPIFMLNDNDIDNIMHAMASAASQ